MPAELESHDLTRRQPGPDSGPLVREARDEDNPRITELAIGGMDWSPLMRLGTGLVSLIYRNAIVSPRGFCLVAEVEGRIEGFIFGTFDSRKWYRDFVLRQGFRAFWCLLPRLFVPRHLKTIWRGLTYFPEASPEDPPGELLSAVVNHELKRSGVGTVLFRSAMSLYLSHGIRRVKFGDIDVRNEASNAFFGSKAVLHRTEPVYGGNHINVYHYDIPDETA